MFVDEVEIKVIAGDGGDGCTAFRREKFVPEGGPDGGNGGKGSNIIFKVDQGLKTLIDLRYKKTIKGNRGEHGSGKNKSGRTAEDIIVKVPEGTTIRDAGTNLIIGDLIKKDDEIIVACGGRGGRGNKAFSSASNPAPDISEKGEPGEFKILKVELKMLADVGLVGMPSVGKSTILSKISNAKPKIAEYHFTTLNPNLGVVTINKKTFVVADLPGLIEGASNNEGLGDQFLKHIERTKIIAHVIDMGAFENRDPYDDYLKINKELELYSKKLTKKPQIIIANKMDLENAKENLKKFKKKVKDKVYEISAINSENLENVLIDLSKMLENFKEEKIYEEEEFEDYVLYKFKEEKPFKITKDNNAWIVTGEEVEKLFKMTKFSSNDATIRFTKKLRTMGIDDKLRELGAKDQDTIRILGYEFTFIE